MILVKTELKFTKIVSDNMGIITNPMRKFILSPSKKGYNQSEYYSRIIRQAHQGIRDLTFLLENTPERLQSHIFNEKILDQFFQQLFKFTHTTETSVEQKRLRMLKICNLALSQIAHVDNGPTLAPNSWKTLKELPPNVFDDIYGFKVIQALIIEGNIFLPNSNNDKK